MSAITLEDLMKEIKEVNRRIDSLEKEMKRINERIDSLEKKLSDNMEILERKLNLLDGSFNALLRTSNLRSEEEWLDLTMKMRGEGTGFNNTKRKWSIW